MKIELIERDIKDKEEALIRCRYNQLVYTLGAKETLDLSAYEAFYLQDQLNSYRVVLNVLREDQPIHDEMLPDIRKYLVYFL